jgi:hypothetical protein
VSTTSCQDLVRLLGITGITKSPVRDAVAEVPALVGSNLDVLTHLHARNRRHPAAADDLGRYSHQAVCSP